MKYARERVALTLRCGTHTTTAQFFVMDQNIPPTLSGSVAEELGLIKRMATITSSDLYEAAKPFDDVFQGLGRLKNVSYRMKLKPGAQGIVKPPRKVPIALRDKVKKELDRMEHDQVITKVTEPTD